MIRTLVLALLAGGLSVAPAAADPMPIRPDFHRAQAPAHHDQVYYTPSHQGQPAPRTVAPQDHRHRAQHPAYVAAEPRPQADLGGGFIEFLFGGGRPVAQPQPHAVPDRYDAYPRHADPRYASLGRQAVERIPPPIDPQFLPQVVPYQTTEQPGTVIVDTSNRFLFLVQEDGTARRYGIGVGRIGFTWTGVKTVSAKREWPDWRPPPQMLEREPHLPRHMPGGIDNPLGARALYLGNSLYRIHGSNEPWTIGQAVSSGCFRMRNEDVIDLYERVRVGARVVVI